MHVVRKSAVVDELSVSDTQPNVSRFTEERLQETAACTTAIGEVVSFSPLQGYGEVRLEDGRIAVLELTSLARLYLMTVQSGVLVAGLLDTTGSKLRFSSIHAVDWSKVGDFRYASPAAEVELAMETGRVKWFNATKGYGFIIADRELGGEVFVHIRACKISGLPEGLEDGQKVMFRYEKNSGDKLAATSVKLCN